MITTHSAFEPQDPSQGLTHFSRTQARLLGHSSSYIHSGRQFGALPIYPGWHEQAGVSPTMRHCECGPQGEGIQGLPEGFGSGPKIILLLFKRLYKSIQVLTVNVDVNGFNCFCYFRYNCLLIIQLIY